MGDPTLFAVFAVFAGNYQRRVLRRPQESWALGGDANKKQRDWSLIP
jgi:hypothetical protein